MGTIQMSCWYIYLLAQTMKSQTSDLNENSTNGKPGLDDQQDSD